MTETSQDIWTPGRRRALVGLVEHFILWASNPQNPLGLESSDSAGDGQGLDQTWIRALGEGPYAHQDALVADADDPGEQFSGGRTFNESIATINKSAA